MLTEEQNMGHYALIAIGFKAETVNKLKAEELDEFSTIHMMSAETLTENNGNSVQWICGGYAIDRDRPHGGCRLVRDRVHMDKTRVLPQFPDPGILASEGTLGQCGKKKWGRHGVEGEGPKMKPEADAGIMTRHLLPEQLEDARFVSMNGSCSSV